MSSVYTKAETADSGYTPLSALTDEQLVLEYRETGSECLFAELVRRYERELYSYLRRQLGSSEMAEDAFQAAFLQLHLKCDQFQEGRKLRPWLYMIATNKAIDLQRRNKRHKAVSLDAARAEGEDSGRLLDLLPSNGRDPYAELERAESGRRVAKNLSNLPEHLRLVVHLVYYQGLKYREAAEVLSIPVGTIKSRLHAAITKLTDACDDPHANDE